MSETERLRSVITKIYNTLITERDQSAAEVCYLLLKLNLTYCFRILVEVNCHSDNKKSILLISEDDSLFTNITVLQKYKIH